jgi:hypothetical protein
MKEATGELSTTVIAVVAIAAVLTIFTTLLLPYLKSSITSRMHCSDASNCTCPEDGGRCTCYYDEYNEDGTFAATKEVRCTNPNA